ncbi:DUF2515 family protein [Bacillus sp. PK3_68]|uniref:DUF2515 family protein n=1 Tax=Bacillus sp. PK3_68 TaxID=2027408 RepID=UPI000E758553|nr:DUF2515 family protein [Bacillus sp. PK3_68]RJS61384.1 hypothetical protein CJ483_16130 [Bacillus sp. PK3_68]
MFFSKKQEEKPSLPANLVDLRKDLKTRLKEVPMPGEVSLPRKDQQLLQKIRLKTSQLNANNITRTKAYLDFYCLYPEIHWAFLGHMVSRNGGWNMTDLQGELHARLLNKEKRHMFFSFLERGNWLIFQDAYPQLLLFMESKRENKNMFYLLPYLNVSVFMEVVWNHYWKKEDRVLLAVALIVNEQNYLEKRVMQKSLFQKQVFQTLEFAVQDLFSFNHLLFPFYMDGSSVEKAALVGVTLHHFDSLHERIRIGKRLYRLLFQDKTLLGKMFDWAIRNRHTGTRKDYWPHIFNDINEGIPGARLTKRLKGCQLRKGEPRLYSPKLEFAWKNAEHSPAEVGDWFDCIDVIAYLRKENEMIDGEIMNEYCKTLERLELAAIAKKAIFT